MKEKFITIFLTIIFAMVNYYIMLPPLNLSSPVFWTFFALVVAFYTIVSSIQKLNIKLNVIINSKPSVILSKNYFYFALPIIVIVILFINVINMPFFNSKAYYNRIKINEEHEFAKDIPEVDFNALPLLDKVSSQKLGDRVMGQMPELVSQFTVSNLYTQINYNNDIVRVTPLEYANVVKYFTNRKEGVTGYIILNSITGKSELIKLDKGMKYMPSALFNENLERALRFRYPTQIFGKPNFEIDNDGRPYWIVPTLKYAGVGIRKEVTGAILFDPVTGKSEKYKVGNVPSWVDHVFPSELIIEQTNDWGAYKRGFFNSIFGQKGMVATTEGYNYTVMNDDVYLYTGITSVGSDESNIGFILTNLRTKETNFYAVSGAEEYSAMASAEGQVQQMKYKSSFPLLINLNNKPTYLLSLKDNAGLVKMYAFVDVVDYQKVVVTDAKHGIETAANNYLSETGAITPDDNLINKEIIISKIKQTIIDGTTIYYLVDNNNDKYRLSIKVDPNVIPYIEVGSKINVSYKEKENINEIIKLK